MSAPRRTTYIPPKSDASGRRASMRLWRPLLIVGVCSVVLLVGLVLAKLIGGVQ